MKQIYLWWRHPTQALRGRALMLTVLWDKSPRSGNWMLGLELTTLSMPGGIGWETRRWK